MPQPTPQLRCPDDGALLLHDFDQDQGPFLRCPRCGRCWPDPDEYPDH